MRNLGIALIYLLVVFSCNSSEHEEPDGGSEALPGAVSRCQDGDDCGDPPPSCNSCCASCNSCCSACPICQICPICPPVSILGTLFEPDASSVGSAVALSTDLFSSQYTFFMTTSAISMERASAVGIISGYDDAARKVWVTVSGRVALAPSQWAPWTGYSGGLASGSVYYLDAVAGTIRPFRPTYPGTYVSQVGIAISSTVMQLTTPSYPTLNP